jgi:hypothetical protein
MRAFRSIRRSRVGAMESLTVVILAVAAIVIAAMIWAFLSSSVGMQQTSADFTITSVEVRQMTTGQCRIFVNIRNNGGQSFNFLEVEVSGPGGTGWRTSEPLNPPLNPGQMTSRTYQPFCQSGWFAGTPLLVRVTLTTPTQVQVSKNVNTIIQFGA